MKKRTIRPARTPKTTPPAIPPLLAGIVSLIQPPDADRSEPMARALAAARVALADALNRDVEEDVAAFVGAEAARGPWKDLHAYIDQRDEHPDQFTSGDYVNIYSIPALAIGLALAYVYLKEGGAR
jgi:hypothetical protein